MPAESLRKPFSQKNIKSQGTRPIDDIAKISNKLSEVSSFTYPFQK